MRSKLIFGLFLILLAVVFTLQNADTVPVRFFIWKPEIPVALIIVISVSAGVILGLLFTVSRKKRESENKTPDETPLA